MKLHTAVVLVGLLCAARVAAQELTGSYQYQSPQGAVSLSLQQDASGRVTGSMRGADGSTFQLQGTVQESGATGAIVVGGGTGWFAAGFNGPTLILVVAEIDAATGQPDLNQAWNLEFMRVDGAASPAPAPAESAATPTGATPPSANGVTATGPFGPVDESALAREWREMIRGAKLTRISSYSSSTAGGGGYSEHWEAYVCSDNTLYFRDNSVTSMGDLGAYSARTGGGAGQWEIVTRGDRAFLASRLENQQVQYGELTYNQAQRATFLDGKRFYITRENDACP